MSFFPKSQWTDWARDWGLAHRPQRGRFYRDECVTGLHDGLLVQVKWTGDKHAIFTVIVGFPGTGNVAGLRDALIADSSLDSLPGKGARRRKTAIRSQGVPPGRLGSMPEFTLTEHRLIWARLFPWSAPKPDRVRAWVETLLSAVGRATRRFDGRCENCDTGRTDGFVLVDGEPMVLCGSCQQRLLAEGEMAERSYDMQDANHLSGLVFGMAGAAAGSVVWAALEILTGRIFAAVALGMGVLVAWAYRRGAGRVDAAGRVIAVMLTLGSVMVGDVLIVAFELARRQPALGFPLVRAAEVYSRAVLQNPTLVGAQMFFGLFGAWASARALRKPNLRHRIEQPATDSQSMRKAA